MKIDEVREEDVHSKKTILNEERVEALKAQQDNKKQQQEKEKQLNLVLRQLEMKTGDVRVSYGHGEACELLQMDLQMLKTVEMDILDRVIFACLWQVI